LHYSPSDYAKFELINITVFGVLIILVTFNAQGLIGGLRIKLWIIALPTGLSLAVLKSFSPCALAQLALPDWGDKTSITRPLFDPTVCMCSYFGTMHTAPIQDQEANLMSSQHHDHTITDLPISLNLDRLHA
jgi:hypothetical protein